MKAETYKTKHTLVQRNPLTGNFLLTPLNEANSQRLKGQNYFADDKKGASQMAQTMDHYEDTGEKKAFKSNLRYLGEATQKES